ncbi:MAG TPA: S9 family peptidase [Thermoanaerobaculia bacterium]|jgi:dipeptidyl aminopeptidase/acylaminoacyl peptidase|nr:S9 family peptidase [Thermoanaerobaculia bacterium]
MRSLPIPALLILAAPAFAAPPPHAKPTAADLAAAVERMARVSTSSSPSLSPDGQRVAFVSNRSGVPQVWITTADGVGEARRVGSFDDPVTGVDWSPDGQWLALSVAPGGGLNEQIYLVHPDGSDLKRITDGGKENNRLAGWSGKLLRFSSSRKDPASLDAYLYDSATGATRFVAANPGVGTLTDVSRDGKRAVVSRVLSRGDNNLFLIDLATGKEELLTPHDPPGSFGGGKLAPDGATVYLTSNKDTDNEYLAKVNIAPDGKLSPLQKLTFRDEAEVDDFDLRPAGTGAAVAFNVAGRSELAIVDLLSLQLYPVPKLPGEIVTGLDFSEDGKRLAFTAGGARLPNEVWVLNMVSGKLRQVTFSPHDGVDLAALVAPELFRFPAADGLGLSGWLYRPAGGFPSGGGPVVISFHGGPEGQERPSFRPEYQALLASGIGVFAPNVRGSAGFGKRFVNLDNGPLRIESLKDIKACVDFLVSRKIADPKRIGIMGGSYGGYMTLAGLTEYPDLFAAGADLYGIVNFETFFAHTEPWMAAVSTKEYGDPVTQKDLLRQLSPLYKLERVKAPLLVLHGANDTNVPLVEAQQVAEELKKRGVPVESVIFPDEGHGFRKIPNRVRSTVEIVRWFERYLKATGG